MLIQKLGRRLHLVVAAVCACRIPYFGLEACFADRENRGGNFPVKRSRPCEADAVLIFVCFTSRAPAYVKIRSEAEERISLFLLWGLLAATEGTRHRVTEEGRATNTQIMIRLQGTVIDVTPRHKNGKWAKDKQRKPLMGSV